MSKGSKLSMALGSAVAAALVWHGAIAASKAPTITGNIARPLVAAQKALKEKKFDEAVTQLLKAQAAKGKKTAYDNFAIDALLGNAYMGKADYPHAAVALEHAADSSYASKAEKGVWYRAVAGIYYQEGKFADAVRVGREAIAHGEGQADVYNTVAQALFNLHRYKEAGDQVEPLVQGAHPSRTLLLFQWNAYTRAKDKAGANRAIDKLVSYYPRPAYWLNALAPLLKLDITDPLLQLNVYRLMNAVGVLNRPYDISTMAELALDRGYPGLTVQVLKKAFANNYITDASTKNRLQHLMSGAEAKATQDRAGLMKEEDQAAAMSSGQALVDVGTAYLSYGMPEKAASAIRRGIAKGGVKNMDNANLLLGMAELQLKNTAEAMRSFAKVSHSKNENYSELGRLWELHAGAHNV